MKIEADIDDESNHAADERKEEDKHDERLTKLALRLIHRFSARTPVMSNPSLRLHKYGRDDVIQVALLPCNLATSWVNVPYLKLPVRGMPHTAGVDLEALHAARLARLCASDRVSSRVASRRHYNSSHRTIRRDGEYRPGWRRRLLYRKGRRDQSRRRSRRSHSRACA